MVLQKALLDITRVLLELITAHCIKKATPTISVAFLTLMTMKLENKEICAKSTQNEHNYKKELSKFDFSGPLPLIWPF